MMALITSHAPRMMIKPINTLRKILFAEDTCDELAGLTSILKPAHENKMADKNTAINIAAFKIFWANCPRWQMLQSIPSHGTILSESPAPYAMRGTSEKKVASARIIHCFFVSTMSEIVACKKMRHTVALRRYPSGQRGRAVNALTPVFIGSNPIRRTHCQNQSMSLVLCFV